MSLILKLLEIRNEEALSASGSPASTISKFSNPKSTVT